MLTKNHLSLVFLLWTKVLCKNIKNVSYDLEDFSLKDKKIGNLIYSAKKLYDKFDNAVLLNHNNLFDIKVNGDIYTKVDIDRDEVCVKLSCCQDSICYIVLKVYLFKAKAIRFNVKIAIHDNNDNTPQFVNAQNTITIPESAELQSTLKLPVATDADSSKFGIDGYSITDLTYTFISVVENNEPYLKLVKPLDREKISSYNIQLIAYDKGFPQLSNTLDIKIRVLDVNDNAPYFVNSESDYTPLLNISGLNTIKIKENHSGDIIYHLHAHDIDEGENSKIFYSISSTQSQPADIVKQKFSLKSPYETAKIQLRQNLDYEIELERLIHLIIVATDNGKPPQSASITLTIQLLDENDNHPVINETMSKDIKENDRKRHQLKIFSVTDKDSVSQNKVKCLLSEELKNKFELQMYDWNLYDLYNKVAFDFETKKSELVRIICVDRGEPEITQSVNFYVKIIDQNDNSPMWEKDIFKITLQENDNSLRVLTTMTATDDDSGSYGTLKYNISAVDDQNITKYVKIDHETGIIYSNDPVDREFYQELLYIITAFDNSGKNSLISNQPSHSNSTKLLIKILDENDNSPMFMGQTKYYKISENAKINNIVGKLEFYDPDEPPNNILTILLMEYNINTHTYIQNKWFKIINNNTIAVKNNLDREEVKNVSITVNVQDHGRPSRTVTEDIIIEILDENDNAPSLWYPKNGSFISSTGIIQTTPFDTKLIQLEANDPDNGLNATIKYKIIYLNFSLPNALKINKTTGEISTNWHNFEPPDIGVYFLHIRIDDHGTPPQSILVVLFVNITNINHSLSAEAYMSNIVILILIIVCSLALIVSLIAAIFWVRFRVTGDTENDCQEENLEREHLNKEIGSNHYSLKAMENNFNQSPFENSNINAFDLYSARQQNIALYGNGNTLNKEAMSILDSSRLTPCEDCFNSFGTIPTKINRYESPNVARFRSPISSDFNLPYCTNSANINSKALVLQTYPVNDFNTISNTHPPNLMGEPNFSDSGKGGSVEDLNYRLPIVLSTFTTTQYNTTTSLLNKQPGQNQNINLNTKNYVQNKNSETIFN